MTFICTPKLKGSVAPLVAKQGKLERYHRTLKEQVMQSKTWAPGMNKLAAQVSPRMDVAVRPQEQLKPI